MISCTQPGVVMRPAGPKSPAPHQARFPNSTSDSRICPNCAITRAQRDIFCGLCQSERPPNGWTRVVQQGVSPLDDASHWVIESRLRPSGPVLRHRVRCEHVEERNTIGVLHIVNDSAVFPAFEARADALSSVRHATVQTPIRTGRHRGRPYRIDALCTAPRLASQLTSPSLPQARRLLVQLAGGIAELHRHGVVHGNIGPRRVALLDDSDGPRVLLLAIPAISAGPWEPEVAPEVLRGAPADARADVFGLGLLFWALTTGRDPRHESRTTWADERPGPALTVHKDLNLSEEDRGLLAAMLDRDPVQRPQDIAAVLAHLRGADAASARRALPVPRPPASRGPVPPPSVRPRLPVMALTGAAAIAFMGMAGLVLSAGLWPPEQTAPVVDIDGLRTADQPPSSEPAAGRPKPTSDASASPGIVPKTDSASSDTPTAPAARRVSAERAAPIPAPARPTRSQDTAGTASPAKSSGQAEDAPEDPTAPVDTHPPEPSAGTALPLPAEEPTSASVGSDPPPHGATGSAPSTPQDPRPAQTTADHLAGAWSGTVNGRPASLQLYTSPDGRLSGFAAIRVGARPEQHPIQGRYRINDSGSISVSLIVKGTSTAWTGRVIDDRFAGAVLFNGKSRGDYDFSR